MLCSDGLSDVVTEATLRDALMRYADRDQAVNELIELAIRGGGPDNITCIVADVVDEGATPAGPGLRGGRRGIERPTAGRCCAPTARPGVPTC